MQNAAFIKTMRAATSLQVGYQFVMRWVNNHIYYLKAKSPLALRILDTVHALPYEDSKAWRKHVLRDLCGPKGYHPVTDHKKLRDIYNICVLKSVMAADENYGDDSDNVLLDHPLVRNNNVFDTDCMLAYACRP